MSEDPSETHCGIRAPILWNDHRGVMSLAARAQDLLSHYPDFGHRREADAVVGARGRQLLDRQSHGRLDRKPEGPVGMAPTTLMQRARYKRG